MPIFLWAGAVLAATFGATAAVVGGENLGNLIGPPKQASIPKPAPIALPWYVPIGLTMVGGVLLYKYGSKILKV